MSINKVFETEGVDETKNENKPSGPDMPPPTDVGDKSKPGDIAETPESQEPDFPPFDDGKIESDKGTEQKTEKIEKSLSSPEEKRETDQKSDGGWNKVPKNSPLEKLRTAIGEAIGKDITPPRIDNRPINIPIGSTLQDYENPLFKLKDAMIREAGGGRY